MAAAEIWNIEDGVLALSLVGDTDDSSWQTPGGKSIDTLTAADYTTPEGVGVDFSCQVTTGALTASPNTSDKTTPATFCSPEVVTTQVGVTSYSLEATILQDPHVVDGISRYLFQNDTLLAYFALGLDSWGAPKAAGKCRIVAGAFGGDARTDLTADLSLPVETKPDIQFGTDAGWVIVAGDGTVTEGPEPPAVTSSPSTSSSSSSTPEPATSAA